MNFPSAHAAQHQSDRKADAERIPRPEALDVLPAVEGAGPSALPGHDSRPNEAVQQFAKICICTC